METEPIFCDQCQSEIENGFCECPPPVSEIKTIPVTYNVRVKFHTDSRYCWSTHSTLEDAIKAWSFGDSRCGAHHWDREYCHVAKTNSTDPNEQWALLYIDG